MTTRFSAHGVLPSVGLSVEALEPVTGPAGTTTERIVLSADRPVGLAAVSLLCHLDGPDYDGILGEAGYAGAAVRRVGVEADGRLSLRLRWGLCPVAPGHRLSVPLVDLEEVGRAFHIGDVAVKRAAWECLCLPGLSATAIREAWHRAEAAARADDAAACDDGACDDDPWGGEGFDGPEERVARWSAVPTEVGRARARRIHLDTWDPNRGGGAIEVALGDRVWTGSFSDCVDGHESYSLAGVRAATSPHLDLHGQDHARDLAAFVRFALPLIVGGRRAHVLVGQPVGDGEADVAPAVVERGLGA